jgi:2-oxo-3-hexenedioate decarboxylase
MRAQPHGWSVGAGDVVTTGTLTDAWPLQAGQVWHTRIVADRLPGLRLDIARRAVARVG